MNRTIFSNFIWRFAERSGAQLVAFIVSVVLARILEPTAYGTIALITVFTSIMQVFVDSGLGNALIQKKDADDLDFSTVFYTNIVFCVLLYGLIFVTSLIAAFYNDLSMTPYIRVLGLTVLISGVKNIQQAYVSKKMLFRKFFMATIGGTVVAGIAGVVMALKGFGVWALVAQHVINIFIDTLILWITVRWRPHRKFSITRLRGLFSYGWKLLLSSLIDTAYNDLRQLIIGKMYGPEDLAYYNKGRQFPNLIVTNVNSAIDSVLFPVMAQAQDDKKRVKKMTQRAIKTSVYIMAPLMMGMAFIATPLIRLVLTEKWLPAVPFLRIFCITFMFRPIHTANLNAIKAIGRSDLFLKLEIIKKIVGLILLLTSVRWGVMAMAYSLLVNNVASQIINSWPNRKLLDYNYLEQLKDILPNIALSVFMGVCVLPVELLGLPDIVTICIQVILGGTIYVVGSIISKNDSFRYLWDTLVEIKKRKAGR